MLNKVFITGNLTKDPETTTVANGDTMCRFTIAVNRRYTNKQTGEKDVDFFNVTCWRGLAESCGRFLAKGKKVMVMGSLENRQFDDKDGNRKFYTDIIADEVEFFSAKDGGTYSSN